MYEGSVGWVYEGSVGLMYEGSVGWCIRGVVLGVVVCTLRADWPKFCCEIVSNWLTMDSPSRAVDDKSSGVILMVFFFFSCISFAEMQKLIVENSFGHALHWCKVCSVFCAFDSAFQFLQENVSRYVTLLSLGYQCSLNFFNMLLIVISFEA